MSKHYDVAILGRGIGALTAAALLARRSWRVLVLGQGEYPARYSYDGLPLSRRPFTFLASPSPSWGRVLTELAQSQTFRRHTLPADPMLQVLTAGRRLELAPDTTLFAREVDREFPEVRRVVDDFYAELARTNAAADAAFEKDVVWPPGGFWERRETERVFATLPHIYDTEPGFLAEFPREHPFLTVVDTPARFASDRVGTLPPFSIARLHGAWARGLMRLPGGEEELTEFLLERVRAHGGEVALAERADRIEHRHGGVRGIVLDGDPAPTGVQFVVSDMPTRSLLDLAAGYVPSRRTLASIPRMVPREWRFVLSVVVRDAGLPTVLAEESFLIPGDEQEASARRVTPSPATESLLPVVHLQATRNGGELAGTTLLVAEALLDSDNERALDTARESILACLEEFLPFVERHYLIVDSPHDGRPLWDYRSGSRTEVERVRLRSGGASLEAEPMIPRWEVTPLHLGGLAGESIRTPLGGAFVVGRTTLPALGQEGELLAAWGAARAITRTDRRKEKMRRDMWSKVELG